MKKMLIVVALAASGLAVSPGALALYKCTTKAGVTYQDRRCMEAPLHGDLLAIAARDSDRLSPRGHRLETEAERQKLIADRRKTAEISEQQEEWVARSTRKSESVRSCMQRDSRCDAEALRSAALYLSESQLEGALGSPQQTQVLGMGRTSMWTVRLNNAGRLQYLKLTAAWGMCSDDRNYFASGQGQRACKVSVE